MHQIIRQVAIFSGSFAFGQINMITILASYVF